MKIGARQRKLSLWAVQDKELRLYDLYGLLCHREWLLAAYDHVKRNTGSRTAGIDKITATDFEEHLDSNIDQLREGRCSRCGRIMSYSIDSKSVEKSYDHIRYTTHASTLQRKASTRR